MEPTRATAMLDAIMNHEPSRTLQAINEMGNQELEAARAAAAYMAETCAVEQINRKARCDVEADYGHP